MDALGSPTVSRTVGEVIAVWLLLRGFLLGQPGVIYGRHDTKRVNSNSDLKETSQCVYLVEL